LSLLNLLLEGLLKLVGFANRLAKFIETLVTCSILLFRETISNYSLGQAKQVLMSSFDDLGSSIVGRRNQSIITNTERSNQTQKSKMSDTINQNKKKRGETINYKIQ